MRTLKIFCSLLLFSFSLYSCSTPKSATLEETTELLVFENTMADAQTIEIGDYFRVIKFDNMYYVQILNEANTIMTDGPYSKPPRVTMIDTHLVKITFQSGTGLSTQWGWYYDAKKNLFSKTYYSIYDECDTNVAYRDRNSIVVSDIFDKSNYYMEIDSFKFPFSITTEPFVDVQFTENERSIRITYLTGDDFQEVVEVFELT